MLILRDVLGFAASEKELAERLTRAYETGDIDGIIALFTDDAWLTMPASRPAKPSAPACRRCC